MSSITSNPKIRTNLPQPVVLALGGALALFAVLFVMHECSGDSTASAFETNTTNEQPTRDVIVAKISTLPPVEVRPLANTGFAVGVEKRVLRGRLLDDQGEPIRFQPYWVHWGHQSVDAQQDLAELTHPLPRAKQTDSLGRFAVAIREPRRGLLWFHAPSGLRAACIINADTLKRREWNNIRLPKTAAVTIHGIGLPPSARFRVVAHPATKSKSGWNSADVELWPARYWRRSKIQVDLVVTHSFTSSEFVNPGHMRVLAWHPFEFEVQGEGFEVLPQDGRERIIRAPGEREFRAGRPTPSGIVVVRDSAGGPPTSVAGIAITGPRQGAGRWHERNTLDRGRCGLGYQMLRAGETDHLWVVMADGEWFETEITVTDTGPQATVTLVRGQGHAPLRVPAELAESRGRVLVFAELEDGQLVRGRPWSSFAITELGGGFGYVLRDDAVLLIRHPDTLSKVFVICEDGSVAIGCERANWVPATIVPDVDLEPAYRRLGKQARARAEFAIEIATPGGHKSWITIDSCAMGPKTTWFPVWKKTAPSGMRCRFTFAIEGEEPTELVPGR